ncbi:uncharacterized protein N7484_001362 [Penicillium longicatenatum]|uniref:uncharacterized protein n=1 Tax=Penicillium longicatenatum TaxID=1561947 RepID=UPI00254922B2|nr:uncharacterized protein N7484_001362 [Penicillium longicatenatum]KAJ5657713.1 hypothetical protein N7484_001362 [Penicillium longicatenatum]
MYSTVDSADIQTTLKGHTKDVEAKPDLTDEFRDNNRKLWDSMIGGDHKKTFIDHSDNVTIVVPPDDKQAVSNSLEKIIKLWSTGIREHQRTLDAKPDWVFLMAFSPDGKQIASSSNNAIDLWYAATGKHQNTLVGHSGLVSAVAFSTDGKQIVSSSEDKIIIFWDLRASFKTSKYLGRAIDRRLKLRPCREIKISAFITTVKFSPDNRFVITNIGLIWLVDPPVDERPLTLDHCPTAYMSEISGYGWESCASFHYRLILCHAAMIYEGIRWLLDWRMVKF